MNVSNNDLNIQCGLYVSNQNATSIIIIMFYLLLNFHYTLSLDQYLIKPCQLL